MKTTSTKTKTVTKEQTSKSTQKSITGECDIPILQISADHHYDVRSSTKFDNKEPDEVYKGMLETLSVGGFLPRIVVIEKEKKYRLVDGYRRYNAHKTLKRDSIPATVLSGDTPESVILSMSIKLNALHGRNMQVSEKRQAVGRLLMALAAEEKTLSQTEIALISGVNQSTVSRAIEDLKTNGELPKEFRHSSKGRKVKVKTSSKVATKKTDSEEMEEESAIAEKPVSISSFEEFISLLGLLRNTLQDKSEEWRLKIESFTAPIRNQRTMLIGDVINKLEEIV